MKSASDPTTRLSVPGRLVALGLAAVLALAIAGCQTPGHEPHDHYYPDPGHPNSPDPAPSW